MEEIDVDLPFEKFEFDKKVETDDWFPAHKPMEYPRSFIRWVNSMNKGWRNMITYKPFELYVKQAKQWLDEDDHITNYSNTEDQKTTSYKNIKDAKFIHCTSPTNTAILKKEMQVAGRSNTKHGRRNRYYYSSLTVGTML